MTGVKFAKKKLCVSAYMFKNWSLEWQAREYEKKIRLMRIDEIGQFPPCNQSSMEMSPIRIRWTFEVFYMTCIEPKPMTYLNENCKHSSKHDITLKDIRPYNCLYSSLKEGTTYFYVSLHVNIYSTVPLKCTDYNCAWAIAINMAC